MKVILLSVAVLAVSVVLLGVKVLFVRGGRFPSGHVHSSPELRRRGIGCASGMNHTDDNEQQN
ncbi:MAG: hypothetical protein K2M12_07680 [Muribaculaceae bacterium]|nr:hypothetical protein [Muribaculaceae bacterium]